MSELVITHPAENYWMLADERDNFYLIAGTERAALIDTGLGKHPELKSTAESLCGKSVILIHSHAHGDHIGGDAAWDSAYVHPSEYEDYRRQWPDKTLLSLEDGDVIDLGGHTLEVIHTPGHTPGSIVFLDRTLGRLFTGDTVILQPVFLNFYNSSPEEFRQSLLLLRSRIQDFSLVCPAHGSTPLSPESSIEALLDCTERALAKDPETMVQFTVDMGLSIADFDGYEKDGYSVGIHQCGGKPIPVMH